MSVTCSTYGGEEKYVEGFWWGKLSERYNLGELSVGDRII